MRPARLNLGVVLVAHGSRDPRAAAATEALARAVGRAHPAWLVRAAYLDHAGPRPIDVLSSLPVRRAVMVPLLLTAAYHGRVDIPAVLEAAASLPLSVLPARVLGPEVGSPASISPHLIEGLVRRLPVAGLPVAGLPATGLPVAGLPTAGLPTAGLPVAGLPAPGLPAPGLPATGLPATGLPTAAVSAAGFPAADLDGVVLAAAGTRDAEARSTVDDVAEALSARLRLPCIAAYASAAPPSAGEAVARLRAAGARRVGVAAYFLAPGLLYDNAVRSALAAGAVAVAEPLADAPDLVRLVAARVNAAVRNPLAPAA